MRFQLSLIAVIALVAGVVPAGAQDAAPAPAHIALVDGTVMLNRDGQVDQAVANMPFVPGDRVRTTTGRVEILFPDGTALDVDQFTEVDLESEAAVHLTEGRALLRVPNARYTTAQYELTTPATAITAVTPGEYRLSYPDAYESARADDFDRWIDAQASAMPATSASAQYLPPDLRMYGSEFDQYGGWQYDASYGYVWYPTVAPGWRPYYDGYWAPIQPYGWTWVGIGAWSWPTHHYGRWGWHHDRWFWIPARSWAPAWVSWGAASDYVSWCPLGWDSRPVFALSVSYGDPWRGWTVMPRGAFTYTRVYVAHHRVRPERVNLNAAPFVVQSRAPIALPQAVARGGAGTLYRGRPGVAVPRNGTAADSTTSRGATGGFYRGPAPAERPGADTASGAVAPRAVPRYGTPAPEQPTAIDRQRTPGAAPSRVVPGPAYRMPPVEPPAGAQPRRGEVGRPIPALPPSAQPVAQPRVAPAAPVGPPASQPNPRVAPAAPVTAPPSQANPRAATPRQEPTARPAPPSTAQPMARPQAEPRAEPSGGGGRPQQAAPPRGGSQGQQPSGQAQPRGKSKG